MSQPAGSSRTPFDALVDAYDAGRPTYPAATLDALEPLVGRRVLDVGAGTGIATRLLAGRGADVVALDLGARPLARLRERGVGGPGGLLGAAVADAHALPVADRAVDLVTYAQAFHWVRADEGIAEAVRVLRPGGALALWWNNSDAREQPWWRAQAEMLEEANKSYARDYRDDDTSAMLRAAGLPFRAVETRWVRELGVADYLLYLRSKSYVAALPGDVLDGVLARARDDLVAAFPDGVVREPFVTRLWVARPE